MKFSFLKNRKNLLLMGAAILLSNLTMAQETATTAVPASSNMSDSFMQIFLLCIVGVLGIVIFGMGNVVMMLSRQLVEKQNREKKSCAKIITVLLIVGLSFFSGNSFAADATTSSDTPSVLSLGGISGMTLWVFIAAIIVEVFAIFYLGGIIRNLHRNLFDINPDAIKISKSAEPTWWDELDKKFFTKAVPVEKEADVLLDHDYDGIKELDNALPPWWKYGFFVTIFVAFVYIYMFHISHTGLNPREEYNAQMEEARIAKEKFDAVNKDKVDEANVPMADKAGLDRGMQIFKTDCFPCHGQLGEGGAGPNLTDDYWLHKGGLNDIFKSIKNGYPDKGMQSWLVKYNPKQISEIASYIKTLHGTNPPNAKAPQGDIWKDEIAPANDSTAKKTDSIAVVKK